MDAAKSHWYNTYNAKAAVRYSGEPVSRTDNRMGHQSHYAAQLLGQLKQNAV